ncbi:MAG: hypothetical protein ACUVXA_01735 [Candidatus Jordarchaeum sp.]|uniref:hypothetical protein n=1 Tax=Candidatus Jordarchaeum sp. TaxID=2823881 RepID=UPI0040498406
MEKQRLYLEETRPPISDSLYNTITAHRKLYRKLALTGGQVKRLRGTLKAADIQTMLSGKKGKLTRLDVMLELYCDEEYEKKLLDFYNKTISKSKPEKQFLQTLSEAEEHGGAPSFKMGLSWSNIKFNTQKFTEELYELADTTFLINFELELDGSLITATNLSYPIIDETQNFFLVEYIPPFKVAYPNGTEQTFSKLTSLMENMSENLEATPKLYVMGNQGRWKPLITFAWQFEDGLIYVKIPSENGKTEEKEFILNPVTGNIELIKGQLKVEKAKSAPKFKPERIFFFELGGDELAKPESKPEPPKQSKKKS